MMTAIQPNHAIPFPRTTAFDRMPDQDDQEWHQHQYGQQNPYFHTYYGSQSTMRGMQDMDLSLFQQPDTALYETPYATSSAQLIPPIHAYSGDPSWNSDVEMGTPSTNLSHDYMDYRNDPQQQQSNTQPQSRLRPPATPHSQLHSPNPNQQVFSAPIIPQVDINRPPLPRSTTAPEPRSNRPRRATNTTSNTTNTKRTGSGSEPSDSGNEAAEPSSGVKQAARGRKRQRIPHTAVERRYRENLNAHLDRLRQTVPSLASRRLSGIAQQCASSGGGGKGTASSTGTGEAAEAKPSKCEILNGAIEYIGGLDRENRGLRDEVRLLRGRLEDLERWYSASLRSGTYTPG